MTILESLFVGLFLTGILSAFIVIVLLFYIGRTRIKEIDREVYGYEFPYDSIFSLMIRVPNYASAFLWQWSAKRSGLEGKIEQFDSRFRWPFAAVFFLMFFGLGCLILSAVFKNML